MFSQRRIKIGLILKENKGCKSLLGSEDPRSPSNLLNAKFIRDLNGKPFPSSCPLNSGTRRWFSDPKFGRPAGKTSLFRELPFKDVEGADALPRGVQADRRR